MTKNQKKDLHKIIVAACFYIAAEIASHFTVSADSAASAMRALNDPHVIIPIILFLISYIIVGAEPIITAGKNIMRGQVFDENFLMTVATIGALALGQWDEAVAVMLFYTVGELFEDYAVDRSRRSISDLMEIRPDYATLIGPGGEQTVDPYDVSIGDTILVRPGEKVPLDGIVIEGSGTLDTSALTGESLPRDISEGMEITSGFIDLTGLLKIRVTAPFEESTVSKILDLVENAGSRKAHVEKFITKFARYYTPAVVFSALALAIMPPLIGGGDWSVWVYRALLFLVISCPCALVISVPLAFFGGVGAASKVGILVKGSNYLEALSDAHTIVFDKTGTLTTGNFSVTDIFVKGNHSLLPLPDISSPDKPADGPVQNAASESSANKNYTGDQLALLKLAAHIEHFSDHPISVSIREAYDGSVDEELIGNVEVLPGRGIKTEVSGRIYYAGNEKLMRECGAVQTDPSNDRNAGDGIKNGVAGCTAIMISDEERYLGSIFVSDTIKSNAAQSLATMRATGIKNAVMLTGDSADAARKVGTELGIDEIGSELLPQDKVAKFEEILDHAGDMVAYVGDGINDAPALARADIGIAMGGAGSQAAIEAADIVIMDDDISKIPVVMDIAGRTVRIARQNVVFALGIKGLFLLLGALGHANMWMAVFADVGVAVLAILNSMRTLIRHKN